MAPPTPFILDYNEDFKKHVVCVRDRRTGNSTTYHFNDDYQRFTQAPPALQLKEFDLEPLYLSQCQTHSEIVFCKAKALGDQVFKVRYSSTTGWSRVECLCCDYNKKLAGGDDVLYVNMSSDKQVDLWTNNRLNFQPVYSKWCENTEKITVFGRSFDLKKRLLQPYNFINDRFVKSDCQKECCKLDAPPAPFDSCTRGLHYTRTHRDEANRPLMCLAMTWYNKEHGQMNVFMDQDGDIGEYEWNKLRKCFQLVEPLHTRCLAHKPENHRPTFSDKKYDDGLQFVGSKYCYSLEDTLYFCGHRDDSTTRKYIFNPVSLQFTLVQCSCCQLLEKGTLRAKTYDSPTTGNTVSVWHVGNGRLVKVLLVTVGANIIMERAPIRDESHLKLEEINARCESERQNSTSLTLMNVHFEGWVLRKRHFASDGVTPIITVALMDGSVKPCRIDSYAIHQLDCADLTETKSEPTYQNSDRYALDWDLTPLNRMICSDSNNVYFTCYNHFTSTKGIYLFDSTSGHVVHQQGSCAPCCPKTTLIGPNQVISGAVTPLSETSIILATNGEGRLMKIGKNPLTKEYGGMLPLRVISQDEAQKFKHNVKSNSSMKLVQQLQSSLGAEEGLRINQLKSLLSIKDKELVLQQANMKIMETKLGVQDEQHRDREKELKNEIEVLEEELKMKNLELQYEKKKKMAEATFRNYIPIIPTTAHTEFDLTPIYRNYCLHTNHFYITAYNNRDGSIKHYVFNPTTCQLHRQNYCRTCPQDYTKGMKIEKFLSILSAKSPLSVYPVVLISDNDGRLARMGFDENYKGFYKWAPAPLQGPAPGIPSSLSLTTPMKQPIAYFGPYAQDFIPEGRYYCVHVTDFLIFGYHRELRRIVHFFFNQINGYLYENQPCPDCQARNHSYKITPSGAIMSVNSPYSKWPIMLTTNKDGSFNQIAFSPPNNRFLSMPKSIVIPLPMSPKPFPAAVKVANFVPKVIAPKVVTEVARRMVPEVARQEEVVPQKPAPKIIPSVSYPPFRPIVSSVMFHNANDDSFKHWKNEDLYQVPELANRLRKEDDEKKVSKATLEVVTHVAPNEITEVACKVVTHVAPTAIQTVARQVLAPKVVTESARQVPEPEAGDDEEEEQGFSEEECSDKEEDCSDEEYFDEENYDDEEEEESDDEAEVNTPESTTIFQSMLFGIGNTVMQIFKVTQQVNEEQDEFSFCSGEECDCSDEECSDEEEECSCCSDEECEFCDEEYSDEEDACSCCTNEECDCSDEECSDEEEECSCCSDEECEFCDEEYSDEEEECSCCSDEECEFCDEEYSDEEDACSCCTNKECDCSHEEYSDEEEDCSFCSNEECEYCDEEDSDEEYECNCSDDDSDCDCDCHNEEEVENSDEEEEEEDEKNEEVVEKKADHVQHGFNFGPALESGHQAQSCSADTESLTTLMKADLDELSDTESVQTAPEPIELDIVHMESIKSTVDISDSKSIDTVLETDEDEVIEMDSTQDISDNESVNTALDSGLDQDLGIEVHDTFDTASVNTASERELDKDRVSVSTSKSTDKQLSISHCSGNEMGSDISYLDSDLGSSHDGDREDIDKNPDEHVELAQQQEEEVPKERVSPAVPNPVSANPCNIM